MNQLRFYAITTTTMMILGMLNQLSYAQDEENANRCDVSAFITDKDPKGLNVRSAPNKEVISRIPYKTYQPETPITVHIIDAQKSWLKIDRWTDGLTTGTFQGEAWVYSKLIATSVKGDEEIKVYGGSEGAYQRRVASVHEQPTLEAPIVGQINADNQTVNIIDCQGEWIFITGKMLDGKPVKGWLPPNRQCPNVSAACV